MTPSLGRGKSCESERRISDSGARRHGARRRALSIGVLALVVVAPSARAAEPRVVGTIPVPGRPWAVAFNPATNRLYVACTEAKRIAVIDGETRTVLKTIPRAERAVTDFAVNAATNRIYASDGQSGVLVIEGETDTVVAEIPVGPGAGVLALNPLSNRVYVANELGNTVSVIDGGTNRVVASVPVGWAPHSITVDPATDRVYVGTEEGWLMAIDGRTNGVVGSIWLPQTPAWLGIAPGTGRLHAITDYLLAIDTTIPAVVASLYLGDATGDAAMHRATRRIYVPSGTSLRVLDGVAMAPVADVAIGKEAWETTSAVAIDPTRGRVYVTAYMANAVTVVEDDAPPPPMPDTTAPTTAFELLPGANARGWSIGPVELTLTAQDEAGGSGVAELRYALRGAQRGESTTTGNTATVSILAEGITTVEFFARDRAGNAEASQTATVRIDTTPPSLSGSVNRSPNAAGWHNAAVTVTFDCRDALSGVVDCTAPVRLTGDGADQSVSGTAVDAAGNRVEASVPGINIDTTPPRVAYVGNTETYTVDQLVGITCSAADALSGIASRNTADITGPAYTFALGANSFSASAVDRAGNEGRGAVRFTVVVTFDSLCNLTREFVTNRRSADLLCAKLIAAKTAGERGATKNRARAIADYVNVVGRLRKPVLADERRGILLRLASGL